MARLLTVVALIAPAVSAANYGPRFQQKMVPVEGCTLSVTAGGAGPAVLLLHGYAESAQMWKPLAGQLAPRFTVVAIARPGLGGSPLPLFRLRLPTSGKPMPA